MQRRLWVFLACCFAAFPSLAAITGIVMTREGAPIAGARVSIHAYEPVEARRARLLSDEPQAVPLATVQTDAKGAFTLESPKQAAVELAIAANGHAPVSRRVERDEEAGAIALAKAETRTGTIRGGGGKAVANATVVLRYGAAEYVTRTNEQGKYEAPDPKNRARGMVVLHPDFAIDEQQPAGSAGVALDRTLTPGRALSGRVVGAGGETPVAGATILVDGWPVATSGDDGSFTAAHVPSRWSTVTARKDMLVGQRASSKETAYTIEIAKPATISGRITDSRTKLPVAGAIVRLGGRSFPFGESLYEAETDAKGAWSISAPAGTYTLFAAHPSYRPDPFEVTAVAGQQTTRDIVAAQLARVTGSVVDEAKQPVVAASVTAAAADPMPRGMRFLMLDDAAVSGPDGRFALRVELDSDLTLRAVKRGLPKAESERFRLAAGERKSGIVLTIPSGIAVTGRVTDGNGDPLSGVAVTAAEVAPTQPMMVRTMIGMAQNDDEVVRTASDGTFAMRLKEGTYDFNFRREGFAPKSVRGQSVSAAQPLSVETALAPAVEVRGRVVRGGTGVENVRVSAFAAGPDTTAMTAPDGSFTIGGLGPGPLRLMLRKEDDFIMEQRSVTAPASDLVIELTPGGRVTGRVTDSSGKPLTTFQAGIATSRGGGGMVFMAPPTLRDFTSDDGAFTLENVPAGAVTLVANAPGYASGRLNITVEAGKTLSDVELQLEAGVKLTGRVTGPNGAPLSDVSVRVVPSPTGGFATRGSEPSTMTDQNGEYTLDTLLPGDETIVFSHAKYVGARREVTLKGRETRLDVQLSSGLRISGTVVTEGGAAVPDAQVEAWSSGGSPQRTRTNAGGAFEFDTLAPGRYRFSAQKSGLAAGVVEDVDVSSGAPVRITMSSGATLYGRVTGLAPDELANAMVEVRGGGRNSARGAVDAQGNYRVEGAPTGSVHVVAIVISRALAGQKTSTPQTIELAPGGSQMLDLAFRSDITIRGRVLRNGTPLANATVAFRGESSGTQGISTGFTDDRGNYTITGVDEGTYAVDVFDMQRLSPYSTKYTVRSSATFDIEFRTGAVRGRVVEAGSNEAIANATVQLRSSTGGDRFPVPRTTITDSAGAFVIDAVPAGGYVLTVSKDAYGNDVRDLAVTESGANDVDVKLSRNDGITLRVVDARDGRPIRAVVTVYDMQGRVVHDQRFIIGGGGDAQDLRIPLAAGSYSASVGSVGYAPLNVTLQSPSQPTIGLTPGGTLLIQSRHAEPRQFRLVDASGIPYARVSSVPAQRTLLPSPATTTWQNVAPGTYALQLLDASGTAVVESRQVVVQEGGTTNAEL